MNQAAQARKSLDQLIQEIVAWQRETFKDGTEEGRIEHFKKEIDEYLADPSNGEEASDVFMLFIAIISNRGIDLNAEAARKLAINKQRTWVKNDQGFSEHVREPDVMPDIDWELLLPEHCYAWLKLEPGGFFARGFEWCVSNRMPEETPRGYSGPHTELWSGSKGVFVRSGLDFRRILRVRPTLIQGE